MLFVAGIGFRDLEMRPWDPTSPYHLPGLQAVMVSYAEIHRQPALRRRAMDLGLREALGLPSHVRVYLDNGAYAFWQRGEDVPVDDYVTFVREARPDWFPVPRDVIVPPDAPASAFQEGLGITMAMNRKYAPQGFVPVLHLGRTWDAYLHALREMQDRPERVAVGGIVPHLLGRPGALSLSELALQMAMLPRFLGDIPVHVFGVGGPESLSVVRALGVASVDSSSWRIRAAMGVILVPGVGQRRVVPISRWSERDVGPEDWKVLEACTCPVCHREGPGGMARRGREGYRHRAIHNLHVLLEWCQNGDRPWRSTRAWERARALKRQFFLPFLVGSGPQA